MGKNCLDAKFQREPEPIAGTHSITLKTDKKTHKLNIQCERYYDAQCSTRGNFWRVRAKGAERETYVGNLKFNLPDNYVAEVQLPTCKQLWARELSAKMLRVTVSNMLYYYQRSKNNIHIYKRLDRGKALPREIELYIDINYQYINESS